MQNCLQKENAGNKRPKAAVFVIVSFLCAVGVALSCALPGLKKYVSDEERKYSASVFSSLCEKDETTCESTPLSDAEMNNFEYENAKNASESAEPVINDAASCKNVDVLMPDGSVETMKLESYVQGCVLGEMPLDFAPQAIMAQSVAVRTFTVRLIVCGTSKHKNADVCTDSACCQSFADADTLKLGSDRRKKLADAVKATEGIIMVYDGAPIEAVYHASSGEYTLNSEDVWGGKVEYLRSVPSPEGEAEMAGVLYGHRVGMSQHGANLLAQEGYGYASILKYYYSGISFDLVM